MLVMTTKLTKKKILGAVVAVLAAVCVFCFYGENETAMVFEKSGVVLEDMKMNDETMREEFIEKLGWDAELYEFCEIEIPHDFDEVYEKYNEIQKSQGFDLSKYKGKRVMKYTYDVLNYPNDPDVSLNLLVYKNKLIAGDVCSKKQDGFMHGLEMP